MAKFSESVVEDAALSWLEQFAHNGGAGATRCGVFEAAGAREYFSPFGRILTC